MHRGENRVPKHFINNHPERECWDFHPDKIPAHIREKRVAGGGEIVEATIIEEPMQPGQQELIQRAINPLGVGQILTQIDVREDIVEKIFAQKDVKEKLYKIA